MSGSSRASFASQRSSRSGSMFGKRGGRGNQGETQFFYNEIRECEALYATKEHFDLYVQWCRSAELVPFLQRCYRRLGIVGLLPRRQVHGPPLVLPTLPDFPYGHAFPFYSCLQ